MDEDRVTLIHHGSGSRVELPVLRASQGPGAIDIRGLSRALGLFTYDPGFLSTASCQSTITYIDGDEGVLLYRGYPVDQLAHRSSYLETCYLLQFGELPTAAQLEDFRLRIRRHRRLDEGVRRFYQGFRRDAHPMAMLLGTVGALSALYHDRLDVKAPADRETAAHLVLAKLPTIAADCYRYSTGQSLMEPDDTLDYSENFLHMLFARPGERARIPAVMVRALELILILHADHEQNASTSTVRLASSSGAPPFASIAAGIGSLWGPAHGGANEAVIRMLQSIRSVKEVPKLIERAKAKDNRFRLVGFGHRVYKTYDPRARVIREVCHELLSELALKDDPLFPVALELERRALEDDYFRARHLYPNVDFYSGIILRALGIPLNMFTVIFAMARSAGWVAQWQEMMQDPEQRLGRPRQLYGGEIRRDYVPTDRRAGQAPPLRGGVV